MQEALELVIQGLTLRGMSHIPDGSDQIPAVILFHGYKATKVGEHAMFVKLSRRLEDDGFAVFRFDFSGNGESDGRFQDITVSKEVDEAKAILDYVLTHPRINRSQVTLCGLSMGGLVASLVAGDRPDDVERVVLLAPAGNMKEIVLAMAQEHGMDREQPPEVYDDAGNLVGLPFALDIMGIEVYPRAAEFKGPVLLVHGTNDETINVRVSHDYQENAYDHRAILMLIDGADHTFNRHDWETQVISAVTSFVREASE